ncbi:MAG: hypothetical protein AAFQ57_08615, partial [Cyanobacteria bacterium J06626_14]
MMDNKTTDAGGFRKTSMTTMERVQTMGLRVPAGMAIATVAALSGLVLEGQIHRAIADEITDSTAEQAMNVARVPSADEESSTHDAPELDTSETESFESTSSESAPSESASSEVASSGEAPSEPVRSASAEPQQIAVAPQFLTLTNYPVELHLLDPDADLSNQDVITNTMISQDTLTLPSLWWAQDQFGGKMLEHWLAYPGSVENPRRVDVVVDRQLWGLSSYLQRYTFINYFGTAAKEFGYSLRVFNDQGQPLASYMCDFNALNGNDFAALEAGIYEFEHIDCSVSLDSSGSGALRGHSN